MMGGVLGELSQLDQNLRLTWENIRDATIQLEEAAFDLSRYLDRLDLDPAELAEVNERLNLINRLLNKYGQTMEATLAYRQEIGVKMGELERESGDCSHLDKQIAPLAKRLKELGAKLSQQRRSVAKKLAPLVENQLAELGMEKARFTVGFAEPAVEGGPSGFDQLEFIVQTNPGLAPQPLRKIASGGELSRIMLALKGILAASDRVSVLVFDEIDANVGGRLGSVIGQKLRNLGQHHQVLCITHLPQIACYAQRHLTVRKTSDIKTTASTVRALEGEERLTELAEMMGGQRITQATRQQAKEMLDGAGVAGKARGARRERARR